MLDRGNPRKVDIAVTVRDNAGNEVSGQPARIRVTSVTSQRLRATVRKGGRVRVKHGRPLTIRGQVALASGVGVAGVPVSVTSTPQAAGAVPFVEASGTATAANGRFVIRLAKGPARSSRINSPGGLGCDAGGAHAEAPGAGIEHDQGIAHAAGRSRVACGSRGRVRGGVGANLVVVLQGFERGRWRTFADTRTRAGGRWKASYRFSGRARQLPDPRPHPPSGQPALRDGILEARDRPRPLTHRTI